VNILERADKAGLRVISYTNQTETYNDQRYWIPRDCIAKDAKGGITFRISDSHRRDVAGCTYAIDVWADGPFGTMFGGRYRTFSGALAWFEQALRIRTGEAETFGGF